MQNLFLVFSFFLISASDASAESKLEELKDILGLPSGKPLVVCAKKLDPDGKSYVDGKREKGFALINTGGELLICDTNAKIFYSEDNDQIELKPYDFKYLKYAPPKPYWTCGEHSSLVEETEISQGIQIFQEGFFTLRISGKGQNQTIDFDGAKGFPYAATPYLKQRNLARFECVYY